jgi:hypothetical protein
LMVNTIIWREIQQVTYELQQHERVSVPNSLGCNGFLFFFVFFFYFLFCTCWIFFLTLMAQQWLNMVQCLQSRWCQLCLNAINVSQKG